MAACPWLEQTVFQSPCGGSGSGDATSLRSIPLGPDVGMPGDGEVIIFDSGSGQWVAAPLPAGASLTPPGPADDGKIAVAQSENLIYTATPSVTSLAASSHVAFGSTPAAVGQIRLPQDAANGITWRNNGDTADAASLRVSVTNVLTMASPAGIVMANAVTCSSVLSSAGAITAAQFVNSSVGFIWASTVASPALFQADDTAASATGDTMTIRAQAVTGNTNTVGAALVVRAGDATGAGGTHTGGAFDARAGDATGASGTRTGGDWRARPGSGATADGSLRLRDAAANDRIVINSTGIGFFGVTPVARPAVTAAGVTAAALLTALDSIGIVQSV
jgi:hypothetical protein